MVDLMSDKIEKADDPDTLALVGALASDKTKNGEGFPPKFAANTSGSTQKEHTMSEEKRTRTRTELESRDQLICVRVRDSPFGFSIPVDYKPERCYFLTPMQN